MEETKTYNHFFRCLKNRHKFSIESEEPNNNKLDIPKIRCPRCGSKVELDPSQFGGVSTKPSMASQAKMNIEASMMALKMAAEQKRTNELAGVGKMVEVRSYQKGSEGKTARIPETVVKSIEEKVRLELE